MVSPDSNRQPLCRLIPYVQRIYTLEMQSLRLLEEHSRQLTEYPDLHARLNYYIEKTEHHISRVKYLLSVYNERPPATTLAFSSLHGAVIDVLEEMVPNRLIRHIFDEYLATSMQVTMYNLLGTMARTTGDGEAAAVADSILTDKLDVQRWLTENFPEMILRFMEHDGTEVPEEAWEYARQREMAGLVSAIATFSASGRR